MPAPGRAVASEVGKLSVALLPEPLDVEEDVDGVHVVCVSLWCGVPKPPVVARLLTLALGNIRPYGRVSGCPGLWPDAFVEHPLGGTRPFHEQAAIGLHPASAAFLYPEFTGSACGHWGQRSI
jgi:hypothetical protein